MTSFNVRGLVFKREGKSGDFKLYAENESILLVTNENVIGMKSNKPGQGNVCVRGCSNVSGVPTGWSANSGGFNKLGLHEKQVIDIAFDKIKLYLHEHPKTKWVVFSCDPSDHDKIGTSIFRVCDEALEYINTHLQKLKSYDRDKPPKTALQIRGTFEYCFEYAVSVHRLHTVLRRVQDVTGHKRARDGVMVRM